MSERWGLVTQECDNPLMQTQKVNTADNQRKPGENKTTRDCPTLAFDQQVPFLQAGNLSQVLPEGFCVNPTLLDIMGYTSYSIYNATILQLTLLAKECCMIG